MRIILKFIIKNIKSNKFRTFLIIFSICVSTALFFASMAISSTIESMYLERMRMYYGSSEIIIHPGPDSPESFVNSYKAKQCEGIEYVAGMLQTGGYYSPGNDEIVRLTIKALSFEDLEKLGSYAARGGSSIEPFSGSKIIIGKGMADKYGLSVGDTVDIEVANSKRKLRICAISEPIGFFTDNGNSLSVVTPINTISSLYGVKGSFTELYIKLKDASRADEIMDVLSHEYNRYTVRKTITKEQLKNASSDISAPFIMMTGIVLFMSIFIMYTSYKVIIAERLPVIGTFRSIGAARKSTDFILLSESITYGVIGGFLGCILGVGVLFIMARIIMPSWAQGVGLRISFTPLQFAAAFMLALVLSIISSFFPIRKAAKTSLKDIMFASSAKAPVNKRWKTMLGVPLLAVSIFVPPLLPRQLALPIGFFDSLMSNSSYALISEKYYKLDSKEKYYSDLYVKTLKDPEKVAQEIKKKFARRQPWVMTMEESERRDKESNKMIFDIMTGFSLAAMVIGAFGVLNNYTISFIERKRHLAMYRSMGMSKAQMIKMMLVEALTGGVVGGICFHHGVFGLRKEHLAIPYRSSR